MPDALSSLSDAACRRLDVVAGEPRSLRPHDELLLLSHRQPSDHLAQVYDPVVCLVVRGAKETATTDRRYPVGEGQFLVVTHDMPVVARITRASPERPYLALILSLDRDTLADLQRPPRVRAAAEDDDLYALSVGDAGPELVDAFLRCLRALDDPEDADVLFPLAAREIHYRVLNSRQGQALRHLGLGRGPAGTVSRAIGLIRQDLAAKVSVPTIARHVGLSPSALHHHFKAVTGTTPVQFQKQLRLLEARRLVQSGTHSVTDAAYSVGYASPTQFSREYRRAFGRPPSEDRPVPTPA
ncbi:MAG: AraC family transcriptional regulator [Acidimicrobiales bacterium]|nr:AraC family transcriptional regulator [Acidimicrobiales bacterium]